MVIKASVNESLRKELKGGVVGKLAREKDVKRIQSILMMEGYKSISVTHLGSNMVVLRSPVEGDVDRLLRSKNECLEYFFSELRPWAPNIVSAHRETWIQVFGIPLHIWGEDFFKQVGSKLGVFLDYDEETASMRRFDVARIWIQTDICAAIDSVIKVDVEGMVFNVRVVEERGRVWLVVRVDDGLLDEGSRLVPSEASGEEEEEVFGGGDGNSGDDEASEPELDGDVSVTIQKGGNHEEARVCDLREEEARKRNDPLSSEKSTEIPDSNEGIKSVIQSVGGSDLLVTKLGDKGSELVGPTYGVDVIHEGMNGPGLGGVGGAVLLPDPRVDLGCSVQVLDPAQKAPSEVGSEDCLRCAEGPSEFEQVSRFSSISEPEDVLRHTKVAKQKKSSKNKNHRSISKVQQQGAPKCLRLLEAVKEGHGRVRRRCSKLATTTNLEPSINPVVSCSGLTPSSGLKLLILSDSSMVEETPVAAGDGDCLLRTEAVKLLEIQKRVGFTFELADDETTNQLIEQENGDRAKKLLWEQRNSDQ
jgi:hypothetical protein